MISINSFGEHTLVGWLLFSRLHCCVVDYFLLFTYPPFLDIRRLDNGVAAVDHESLACRIMISLHRPLKLK